MGNKVHPRIFRTGVIYGWNSKWFARRDFPKLLQEDTAIRKFLEEKLKECAVDHVEIERTARALTITIYTAKPGFVIGRGGTGIEDLKKQLRAKLGKEKSNLNLNVVEVSNPSLYANVVMQSIIADLEKRMPFRRILKQNLDRIQKAGAKGAKIQVKGRLNGAEIARDEKLAWGSVPLHNLRADIDYASGFARTLMGSIGVKVWIYRGDVFGAQAPIARAATAPAGGRPPFDRRPPRGPRPMGPRREGPRPAGRA
ncbi:MAG: 30S ribosomal protein S3 [Patescibacteria group bacterium]|nr:30S ribosomal protein S3 [Patescibacteria group bacterium]